MTTQSMTDLARLDELQAWAKEKGFDLTETQTKANRLTLLFAKEQQEICENCTGRESCKAMAEGMQVELFVYKGHLNTIFNVCSKERGLQEQRKTERLVTSARLPKNFARKSFESFEIVDGNRDAYLAAQKALQGNSGLLVRGKPGTGKTHLAASIANKRLAEGRAVVFVTVPELLNDMRKSLQTGEGTELMNYIQKVELLVLDDLGAERATEWAYEQLFVIVNARYLGELQTIVTTNYSPSELIKKVGGLGGHRIVSRLLEMCESVEITCEDWRMREEE